MNLMGFEEFENSVGELERNLVFLLERPGTSPVVIQDRLSKFYGLSSEIGKDKKKFACWVDSLSRFTDLMWGKRSDKKIENFIKSFYKEVFTLSQKIGWIPCCERFIELFAEFSGHRDKSEDFHITSEVLQKMTWERNHFFSQNPGKKKIFILGQKERPDREVNFATQNEILAT